MYYNAVMRNIVLWTLVLCLSNYGKKLNFYLVRICIINIKTLVNI